MEPPSGLDDSAWPVDYLSQLHCDPKKKENLKTQLIHFLMLHQGPGKHWNQSQQTLGERQEFTTYSNQLLIPDCLPRKLAAALVHCHHETILLALRLCLPVSATIKVSCPKWRNVAATKLLRKICQLWGWLVRCFRWGKKGTQRRVFCLGSVTVARPLFAR